MSYCKLKLRPSADTADVEEKKTNGVEVGEAMLKVIPALRLTGSWLVYVRDSTRALSVLSEETYRLTTRIDPTEMSDEKLGRKHRITILNTSGHITRMAMLIVHNSSPISKFKYCMKWKTYRVGQKKVTEFIIINS